MQPRAAPTHQPLWHAQPAEEVFTALQSSSAGLSESEARQRLERHGPNRLTPPAPVSALSILRDQLKGIVVLLLVFAGIVSLLLGDWAEAVAIASVLLINTLIGFATELRARRAMEALLRLDSSRAAVRRDGRLRTIAADVLVPGDVVQIDAGQRVPADGRVIEAIDLRVDEAPLTGESLPIAKTREPLPEDSPLADRTNMVFKGTTVATGTAVIVLTETGGSTEIGRIGALVGAIGEGRTPLERRLDVLGRRLAWLALAVAVVVAALSAFQGAPVRLVVELGIALAVAAVPEALPAVATIALAVGLRRMARRRALVRRLPSVEALGSTTVVCTDKTRTLTSGQMSVVRVWTADTQFSPEVTGWSDVRLREILGVAARASRRQPHAEGESLGGDPVDRAVLTAAELAGLQRESLQIGEGVRGWVPFTSARKLTASFHAADRRLIASVKGAPRRILAASVTLRGADGDGRLDAAAHARVEAANEAFASDGLRVIAVATGDAAAADEQSLHGLTFVGLLGLADPPAAGVRETIATLRRAGLRTIMLTGDQSLTAQAIGRQLGLLLPDDAPIDARELDRLSEGELDARLPRAAAFSRITPEHKLTIVKRLQAGGEIVAMLGDGINDAPALRQADVGVAMGIRGTDVAKEAAAVVLQDDRFETVAAAVEEGRVIFDNIRKFVFYLFSCNLAEVLVLLFAGLAGWPPPLLPLQILWLNIVTDTFPALSLALEPAEQGVMHRPPRSPQEAVLSRPFVLRIGFYALLITASTLAAYALAQDGPADRARTMAFMTLALAQILHLGNARSEQPVIGAGRIGANPFAILAVVVSVVLQLAAVTFTPVASLLRVTTLRADDWLLVAALSTLPAVIGQGVKSWRVATFN